MSGDHATVDLVDAETTRNVAVAAVLAAFTAALAQVSIPVPVLPAPISFQVFAVYAAGLLLAPRWAGFSQGLYLLAGIAGAPVFSNFGGGVGYFLGPTGGYLVGFLLAAVAISLLVHRGTGRRPLSSVPVTVQAGALVVGLAIVYAVGVPWIAYFAGYELAHAAVVGAAVFLPGDVLKILATLGAVRADALAGVLDGGPK